MKIKALSTFAISLIVLGLGSMSITAQTSSSAVGQTIPKNTPKFVETATSTGAADSSAVIDVSIWLKPHNRSEMDSLAQDLYNPKSPNYRHWLSKSEFVSRFAPTAAEAKSVKDFFTAHNLKVVTVGPDNFFVRARGTVAEVQSAFKVQIQNFTVKGKTFRANTSDPQVDGAAGLVTSAVYGLDNVEFSHPFISQASLLPKSKTGIQPAASASGAGPQTNFISSNCFTGKRTETFNIDGVTGTYSGNGYNSESTGCGYSPAEIQTAYNLNALYKEGFDGSGQTIVIIDWCGSPTIMSDANAFSSTFGLPPLTSKNFSITPYPTPSTCAAPAPEINIDVEWAHAIAPGAAINLVVPPSASFIDVDAGYFYAVESQLGNVISGSYGSEEFYTSPSVLITEDLISETAALLGISADFSSGDDGDFTFDYPQQNPPSVSAPADSPWVTAVGGISLALTSSNKIAWQTGWGTNETLLVDGSIIDPPTLAQGFNFGSGGGPSPFFAKPSYQNKLHGPARQVPDISWLGDPFTGAIIAISEPFVYPPLEYTVYGGTSLACPMFSALWAIANQEAGAPLGQAAPYLYTMPASTITDVLPYSSSSNVTATITDASGTTHYSAATLAQPLVNTTKFYSALWDYPLDQDLTILLTFGTDSGLTITPGWDNVTGVGTPNGKAFADYFKQ